VIQQKMARSDLFDYNERLYNPRRKHSTWDAPAPLNLSGILRAEELPTKHMKPVFPFTQ